MFIFPYFILHILGIFTLTLLFFIVIFFLQSVLILKYSSIIINLVVEEADSIKAIYYLICLYTIFEKVRIVVIKFFHFQVAKASYTANQDPMDAAIFYLAMKKKSLVWALFRSRRDDRMTQFFSNNFEENRWRKAALKNAFALLGKQRFEHAAAFFLLAGALRDAIEVRANRFIYLIIFSISLCGNKFLFDFKFLKK